MNKLEQFQLISDAAEKFNKEQHIKPSVETSFMEGAYWANKTMLQEVLEWLKENTYTIYYRGGSEAFNINFESEEQMLQSFKERFNIE